MIFALISIASTSHTLPFYLSTCYVLFSFNSFILSYRPWDNHRTNEHIVRYTTIGPLILRCIACLSTQQREYCCVLCLLFAAISRAAGIGPCYPKTVFAWTYLFLPLLKLSHLISSLNVNKWRLSSPSLILFFALRIVSFCCCYKFCLDCVAHTNIFGSTTLLWFYKNY